MALSISQDLRTMQLAAGEPIVFSLQLASLQRIVEDMTGREFVLSFYTVTGKTRTEISYYNGTHGSDSSGSYIVWSLPGMESEALFEQTAPIIYEISERLDDGRARIAKGSVTVDDSAPRVDDLNSAPRARYITRITRLNDADTLLSPKFEVTIVALITNATPPPPVVAVGGLSDFMFIAAAA